jgi:hypothetical protein
MSPRSLAAMALAAIVMAVTWHMPFVPRIDVAAPAGLSATATAVRAGFGNFTVAVTVGNTGIAAATGQIVCTARDWWGLVLGRGDGVFGPVAADGTGVADVVVTGTSGRNARYVDCALTL